MSMTFLEIRRAVISDRFDPGQDGDVKRWVNFRYAWVWDIEEWTFKRAQAAVTVTAGSADVSQLPADFGVPRGVWRDDGCRLSYIDPDTYSDRYFGETEQAAPEAYTVIGDQLLVGPTPDASSSSYRLLYDKQLTLLSGDGDVPLLPSGHHFLLVHGAAAEGLKLQNDPTWQAHETDFAADIGTMRARYLSPMIGEPMQYGSAWGS